MDENDACCGRLYPQLPPPRPPPPLLSAGYEMSPPDTAPAGLYQHLDYPSSEGDRLPSPCTRRPPPQHQTCSVQEEPTDLGNMFNSFAVPLFKPIGVDPEVQGRTMEVPEVQGRTGQDRVVQGQGQVRNEDALRDVLMFAVHKNDEGPKTPTTLVTTLEIIEKADHVAWRRSAGAYWHHGIVVDVDALYGRLEVINYDGDVVPHSDGEFASVRREWVPIDLGQRDFYRVDYDPWLCYPADVVVDRATSRLGEARYNPFKENCEHFARWCKAGQHRSFQVEDLEALPQKKLKKMNDGMFGAVDRLGEAVAGKAAEATDLFDATKKKIDSKMEEFKSHWKH